MGTPWLEDGRMFAVELEPIDESEPRSYVLAATAWLSNAELIVDCARLGYLRREWRTLDATYGRGRWWDLWRPDELVTNDLDPETGADRHEDFRWMGWEAETFDAVIYDPPYVAPGGRETSTKPDFNSRYGLHSTPAKPGGLQDLINAGLREMARVTRVGGLILVKCKNYVSAGGFWPGTFLTWQGGRTLGLELVDCLEHLSGTGPQSQTNQVHARSNYSTLLVFKRRQ